MNVVPVFVFKYKNKVRKRVGIFLQSEEVGMREKDGRNESN
jgi:hypothetical protein